MRLMYKWKILACLSLLWYYMFCLLFFSHDWKCINALENLLSIFTYAHMSHGIWTKSVNWTWFIVRLTTLQGLCHSSPVILFNFANYAPSIAVELKRSKEITCKWQNQRSETNKYVSWALFSKLQAAGINFGTLLGWTVFKNPNFNPFQSSSVLPIRGSCCICCVILTFL